MFFNLKNIFIAVVLLYDVVLVSVYHYFFFNGDIYHCTIITDSIFYIASCRLGLDLAQ